MDHISYTACTRLHYDREFRKRRFHSENLIKGFPSTLHAEKCENSDRSVIRAHDKTPLVNWIS